VLKSATNLRNIDEVVKELKSMKDKFEFERKVFRKKLKLEQHARQSYEALVKRLVEENDEFKRRRNAEATSTEWTEKTTQLERMLRDERAKNSQSELNLSHGNGKLLQDQLESMRTSFQQQLRDVQRRLEAEVEQAKIAQLNEFDLERRELNEKIEQYKRHNRELESRQANLMKRVEEESNYGENFQNQLRQQLQEAETQLLQQEKTKAELQDANWKLGNSHKDLQRRVQQNDELHKRLEQDLHASNKKLQVELVITSEVNFFSSIY
jgi:chromosome segregation ATPase